MKKQLLVINMIFLFGCLNSNQDAYKPVFELKVIDSIVIKGYKPIFCANTQNLFLFHDYFNGDISIYDTITKTCTKFNKRGMGPGNYGAHVGFDGNITFLNDSIIAIGSGNHLILYDLMGNLINEIKFDSITNIKNIHNLNNGKVLIFRSLSGDATSKSFYTEKQNMCVIFDTLRKTTIESIEFPSDSSIFPNSNFSYLHSFRHHSILLDNCLYLLNRNDPRILQYKIQNNNSLTELKLNNVLHLSLTNYNPLLREFNKLDNQQDGLNNFLQNGVITYFNIVNDTIYTEYVMGFTKDEIKEIYLKENIGDIRQKRFLNIQYKQNKITDDIPLNKRFSEIAFVANSKSFYLQKEPNEFDESLQQQVFYKAELINK